MKPLLSIAIWALVVFAHGASAQQDNAPVKLRPEQEQQLLQKSREIEARQEQARHLLTPEQLLTFRRVSDPQVSPDGKWVLYTVSTPDLAKNRSNSDLFLAAIEGGDVRQLTASPAADYNGRWSPDGSLIAFLSTRNGSPQIFMISPGGGEARKLEGSPDGAANLAWSPDAHFLSFTMDVKLDSALTETVPAFAKANVRIYKSLPVRHWDEWEDGSRSHVFVLPIRRNGSAVVAGESRDLMPGEHVDTPLKPFGGGEQISWSPDGREVAYSAKKGPKFAENTNSDIYVVPSGGGDAKNITEGLAGFDRDPLYSPDGRFIAFHSMARAGFESDRNRLMLYDRRNGAIRELSATLDQWVGHTIWAPDSKALYFSAEDSATVQIYRIEVADGSWKLVTGGWYNHDVGLDMTPDGSTLVYGRRSFQEPTELYVQPASGGRPVNISFMNTALMQGIRQVRIEERHMQSTDGKRVQTWVVYPPDFDPAKKYPMITYCQGGPQATVSQFFSYTWNFLLMASKGYIIVAPNRRGLPGFGQKWNDAITQDWGGMPMQDILACTDEMMKEPYIDKSRVSAIGASAGGYAVFWLAGNHKGRFSSFVSHCGVFNLESMYGSTEELWFTNWENGGPYWDSGARKYYDKHSPHRYAQNWDTPIMIITGEKDYRVPYTQSLEAFTVAQVKGIPSELLVFPEENHFVLHPQEQLLWFNEVFDFLAAHKKKD
jgi:dipeptidyl aminopeptidase/acylaminoacyl peptidase